jgi:acyl-[acyl-carrier-protein]-phospholipid O-acyltransferase/long-chain-fatty-acid--[acyl-carrier-protein] ligase
VEGLDVPVIPAHLDQVWGSIFSFKDGRFFWKWPRRPPYPVTVSFGAPLRPTTNTRELREAVQELESEAFRFRANAQGLLQTQFIRTAKRRWFSFCAADTTGVELSFGNALIATMLFSRWLRKHCAGERAVAVLLPASVGGLVANAAILFAGKTPVNLNFTGGREAMVSAIEQCGIRTVLTSRVFLERAQLEVLPGMQYMEEIRKSFGARQKLPVALMALLCPTPLLQRRYRRNQHPDDMATIIFSSGSTGPPKGVMLSHRNILSNIEGIRQVIHINSTDRIVGVLPLFHSFGFSVTLWLPLVTGVGAVYHPNPTDAKTIGEITEKYRGTILVSTPTFYSGYIRRCSTKQFATLRYAIAGAEKLRPQIANEFKDKFGKELLEGYGCTELSPVVSVNVPDVIYGGDKQIGNKPGTIGRPIPGVAVKVVDLDSGRPLRRGEEGMLLVKGPNLMLGYLGRPELTAEVIRDGWYVTGDIASIDEDGFIRITDRLARFSKIGGEMVPHSKLEEAINASLGHVGCAVTAMPDEQKGEKLIVFHTADGISANEIWEKLNRSELPKLWLPKRENIHYVPALPVLGSGKIDLKAVKGMALERAAKEPQPNSTEKAKQ